MTCSIRCIYWVFYVGPNTAIDLIMQTTKEIAAEMSRVREEMTHTYDGPVTTFVLIARATFLAAKRGEAEIADRMVANILFEELEAREMLAPGAWQEPSTEY